MPNFRPLCTLYLFCRFHGNGKKMNWLQRCFILGDLHGICTTQACSTNSCIWFVNDWNMWKSLNLMCWKLLDFLNFNAQTKTHNELAANCVKMVAKGLHWIGEGVNPLVYGSYRGSAPLPPQKALFGFGKSLCSNNKTEYKVMVSWFLAWRIDRCK